MDVKACIDVLALQKIKSANAAGSRDQGEGQVSPFRSQLPMPILSSAGAFSRDERSSPRTSVAENGYPMPSSSQEGLERLLDHPFCLFSCVGGGTLECDSRTP